MRARLLMLCLFAILLTAIPLSAQDDSESPLLRLLSYVPDTPDYRSFVQYGDQAAWFESWGFEPFASLADFERRGDEGDFTTTAWMFITAEQTLPPNALGLQYVLQDEMRPAFGFDIFNSDRYLQAGEPPEWITLVEGNFSERQIGQALTATGYAADELDDTTLYSINEDYEVTLTSDLPRVAQLGDLNRIVVGDDRLVIAKATPVIESALDARSGETPSLADDPAFSAAAAALEGEAVSDMGALVGAILMDGAQLMDPEFHFGPRLTPEMLEAFEESLAELPALPPYDIAAFATYHQTGQSWLVVALVHPEGTDAEAAAEALQARFESYTSAVTNEPFMELLGDRGVELRSVRAVEASGRPVTLLVLEDPDPTLELDEDGRRDTYVFSWNRMVFARDLGFLAVVEED